MELDKFVQNSVKSLPVFLLLDTSGSMSGSKIDTLNQCVKDMLSDFRNERLTEINLKLCIISFGGNSATLHTDLASLKDVEFNNLTAAGSTPLGSALNMLSDIINDKEKVPSKGYRPVVVLVSDGYPNDSWEEPLENFVNGKRTSKCEKWALGIGQDCDTNMLSRFLNDPSRKVFDASAAREISKFFKLVTLSTITRTRSQNPNQMVDFDELMNEIGEERPDFKFEF